MSLLPEFIFHTVIVRGIRTIRRDSRLLDQLFRNLDQRSAAQMRTFINEKAIDLNINYPRESLKVPAIVILLKSEQEGTAYLGDSMGVSSESGIFDYDGPVDQEPIEILGGAASVSTMSGIGDVVFDAYKALSGTNNTLKIGSEQWSTASFVGKIARLIGGTGVGQTRDVTANNEDTIMVAPNWEVNPDETTIFDIRESEAKEILGEPSSLYDRHSNTMLERRGSLYALSYQIQVIGPNPELTIYLSAILKALFTLSRIFLEQQGIINMKLSATDFIPRTEYQPDFAYMRAIGVDFQYPFDIYEELGDLATTLQIGLEAEGDEVSFTSISLDPEPRIQTDSVIFVDAASVVNADDGSAVVVTRPTTTQLADYMIAARLRFQATVTSQAPPQGWVPLSVGQYFVGGIGAITDTLILELFWRFVDLEESASYSWEVSEGGIVALSVYRNVDKLDPIQRIGGYASPSLAASVSVSVPSLAASPGGMLIASFGTNQTGSVSPNPFTVPGMDQRAEQLFSTTTALGMFDEVFTETEQSGIRTVTIPVGGGQLIGHTLLLRPIQPAVEIIK